MKLGELIEVLKEHDPKDAVKVGFTHPHSYRGYYDQLAFVPVRDTTVEAMLAAAEEAVGEVYHGWKGGEYTMTLKTPVHVAHIGECGAELTPFLLALMLGDMPQSWDEDTR